MIITNVIVTAYCCCKICCGPGAAGITASGVKPVQGVTVAASRNLPLGTRIIIKGHSYIVQDRLAKKYDSRVDIFMTNHQAARVWGKQSLMVTIVNNKQKK